MGTHTVIATRTTLDGFTVELYNDGYIADGLGYGLGGRVALPEAFRIMDDVCLCLLSEVRKELVEPAKAALKSGKDFVSEYTRRRALVNAPKQPKEHIQPKRCSACRVGVNGWELCSHHFAERYWHEMGIK